MKLPCRQIGSLLWAICLFQVCTQEGANVPGHAEPKEASSATAWHLGNFLGTQQKEHGRTHTKTSDA